MQRCCQGDDERLLHFYYASNLSFCELGHFGFGLQNFLQREVQVQIPCPGIGMQHLGCTPNFWHIHFSSGHLNKSVVRLHFSLLFLSRCYVVAFVLICYDVIMLKVLPSLIVAVELCYKKFCFLVQKS